MIGLSTKDFFSFFFFSFFFFPFGFTQSVSPMSPVFTSGQTMTFKYSGGTGSSTDWIGIYSAGQKPGDIASTVWKYIPSKDGEITFDGNLSVGFYDVHLLCCDGYKSLASYLKFEIVNEKIRSRLTYYKASDSVELKIMMANLNDDVFIYYAENLKNGVLLPNAVPLVQKKISSVDNNKNATIKFKLNELNVPLVAVLQSNDQVISFDNFEIFPMPQIPNTITRIGTGSCGNQRSPQPTLTTMLKHDIDCFIYTGDNLYIDTYDMNEMKEDYEYFITQREEFQKLRAEIPIIATWDDHDYGCCDEDKDYPFKKQSQKQFLDFYDEPLTSPRRTQDGIFTSYIIGDSGKKLQIIVLDTRYFEDNKRPNNGCGQNDYCPWNSPGDTSKTMLGKIQWEWLRSKLLEDADLRLIVSSVQFSPQYSGWEGWSIFPFERKKMQKLISETKAEGVFFISGDIHYSEVSKLPSDGNTYPIYDFTASAINQSWPPEKNNNRVGNNVYGDPNFGIIDIDWAAKKLGFSAYDVNDTKKFSHSISFEEMTFPINSANDYEIKKNNFYQIKSDPKTISIGFNTPCLGLLTLFNSNGQLVETVKTNFDDRINFTGRYSGIYFLKFEGKNFKEQMKLIID
jgi:alkaline phosphatase D